MPPAPGRLLRFDRHPSVKVRQADRALPSCPAAGATVIQQVVLQRFNGAGGAASEGAVDSRFQVPEAAQVRWRCSGFAGRCGIASPDS